MLLTDDDAVHRNVSIRYYKIKIIPPVSLLQTLFPSFTHQKNCTVLTFSKKYESQKLILSPYAPKISGARTFEMAVQAYSPRTCAEHPPEIPSGSPSPGEALYIRIPGDSARRLILTPDKGKISAVVKSIDEQLNARESCQLESTICREPPTHLRPVTPMTLDRTQRSDRHFEEKSDLATV